MAQVLPHDEDRRVAPRPCGDDLSREYLAVLVICGGTVRDSDWAQLPESLASRRPGTAPRSIVHEEHE